MRRYEKKTITKGPRTTYKKTTKKQKKSKKQNRIGSTSKKL